MKTNKIEKLKKLLNKKGLTEEVRKSIEKRLKTIADSQEVLK